MGGNNKWMPVTEAKVGEQYIAVYTTGEMSVLRKGEIYWTDYDKYKYKEPYMIHPLPELYQPPVKFEEGDLIENVETGARMFFFAMDGAALVEVCPESNKGTDYEDWDTTQNSFWPTHVCHKAEG